MILQNFIKSLKFVSHCMPKHDDRYYLNGVLFEVLTPTSVRLVCSDDHRLARVDMSFDDPIGVTRGQYIIPDDDIKALIATFKFKKSDYDISLSITKTGPDSGYVKLMFEDGSRSISSQPIDGKFPEYERIMPSTDGKGLKKPVPIGVNAIYLAQGFQACAGLANEKFEGVTFTPRGPGDSFMIEIPDNPILRTTNACVVVMPVRV